MGLRRNPVRSAAPSRITCCCCGAPHASPRRAGPPRRPRYFKGSSPSGSLSFRDAGYFQARHAVALALTGEPEYTTKTEPSFDDMVIKLRRVIIAERFRPQAPYQATPEETHAVLAAWAAAET